MTKFADIEALKKFVAFRKEAGRQIDPETCEIEWRYARDGDPYGIRNLPEEDMGVGREWFVRAPGSDMWIWFYHLPVATRDALHRKHDLLGSFWAATQNEELIELLQLPTEKPKPN